MFRDNNVPQNSSIQLFKKSNTIQQSLFMHQQRFFAFGAQPMSPLQRLKLQNEQQETAAQLAAAPGKQLGASTFNPADPTSFPTTSTKFQRKVKADSTASTAENTPVDKTKTLSNTTSPDVKFTASCSS
eukprot:UN07183